MGLGLWEEGVFCIISKARRMRSGLGRSVEVLVR